MDGILLVDKPLGWTSFDVVAKVRGTLRHAQKEQQLEGDTIQRKVRVGHTGTLDPLATGLLVLLIGSYTKKAPELTKLDKTYEVTMKLGYTSTTGDAEGEIAKSGRQNADTSPSAEDIKKIFGSFTGPIMQVPPAYSAIKIDGQRAYKLARAGKSVKMEARPVTVYSLDLSSYVYPDVHFTARVSSGTYIRSLVSDIGDALDTGAYMTGLRRTEVGPYTLDSGAVDVDGLASPLALSGNLLKI
jgi:tRNA pseudouridine55 synthase